MSQPAAPAAVLTAAAPASPTGSGSSDGKKKEAEDESDLVEDAAEVQLVAQEMVEKIEIVGSRKVQKTKSEKMHVDYIVHVTTSIAGVSWNVNRRYNSFVALHDSLKKLVKSEKDLPALPPKHTLSLTRTNTPESIAKRQSDLNFYLNRLLQIQAIAKSEPWCAFLVGTFHDIFSRLKTFAVKNAKLTSDLSISEQQRLAALAQLQAERRRTEELRDQNTALEAKLKAAAESAAKQSDAIAKLESELNVSRAQTKKAAAERDAKANELDSLASNAAAYRQQTDDRMKALEDANAANLKLINALKAEVTQLQAQKKLLVKGVKELRDGKTNTSAHVDSNSMPVHAAMAVFASGINVPSALQQEGQHIAPAITPQAGSSLSVGPAPAVGTPSGVPVAAAPLTAAAAGAPKKP